MHSINLPHILKDEEWKKWDNYSINNQSLTNIALIQKAVDAVLNWLEAHISNYKSRTYHIYCGPGNNGADGLCLALLLCTLGLKCKAILVDERSKSTDHTYFKSQLLSYFPEIIVRPQGLLDSIHVKSGDIIAVDGLFGSGTNKPLSGIFAHLAQALHLKYQIIIALDQPSGLWPKFNPNWHSAIQATYTLSFELPKLSLLSHQFGKFTGRIYTLPIGLDYNYFLRNENFATDFYFSHKQIIEFWKPRKSHSHKGIYGHILAVSGSSGSMGACVLVCKAALKAGVGKLTACIPENQFNVLQISIPEAQCIGLNDKIQFSKTPEAIILGPGLGLDDKILNTLIEILEKYPNVPKVMDADAITLLAQHRDIWLQSLCVNSIWTPHLGEFFRIVGPCESWDDENEKAKAFCTKNQLFLILKGAFTRLYTPTANMYVFQVGHPGMATGGSGDVLSGIIGSFLGQGYPPFEAACLGIYTHGKAASYYAKSHHENTLVASDIITHISDVFEAIEQDCF